MNREWIRGEKKGELGEGKERNCSQNVVYEIKIKKEKRKPINNKRRAGTKLSGRARP